MRILFVYENIHLLGGIQTLLIRMSKYLSERGHSVIGLLNTLDRMPTVGSDSSMIDEFSRYAQLYFSTQYLHKARSPFGIGVYSFDHIYCCSFSSLMKGLWLVANGKITGRLCVGVYQPREFCWQSKGKRFQQLLMRKILLIIPKENVFFMSKSVEKQTGECLGRSFEGSPIIPISIDTMRFQTVQRKIHRKKIVCLARITSAYSYIFPIIDVVQELNSRGYQFEFHVYGYGDDAPKLEKYVSDHKMDKWIMLHGPKRYSEIEAIIRDAFVAIGTGTSLLEISSCGVPALVAVDSNKNPTTYGYLHETVGYDIGGFDPDHKEFSLLDKIEELANMSAEEYEAVAQKCKLRAEEFSMESTMPRFESALNNSKDFIFPMKPYVKVLDFFDLWLWRFLKAIGFEDPFHQRGMRKTITAKSI